MGITKIAVRRPVTTTMVILVVIVFGFLSINNLKLDMMPNMNIPIAVVSTNYSGAGPLEIESLVTKPLEGALGTVAGVKTISSSTSGGNSLIVLEFEDGTNIDNASLDIRERIDRIKGYLPDGASDPLVMKVNINEMSSLIIGVSAEKYDLVDLKRLVDDKIADRLERQDGVASVSVSGGMEKEISVTLSAEKLRGYGVTESQIVQTLMAENRNTPAGTVKQGDKSLQLRVTGEYESIEEIREVLVSTPYGSTITLKDIADIEETYKEVTSLSYINGIPSVTLSIQKQSTANTVNVTNAVLAEVAKLQEEMPELEIKTIMNPADFITMTLSVVVSAAVTGGILAVVILFLFLRDIRSTLVVAASIPVSIIATFVIMYYTNITINIMSLGGLALGIGMLVDNSIVVLESIFRKLEEGEDRLAAAIEGAREVAMSITTSTLTTVAVFLPITFGGGLTAQIFNQLALTVTFSLLSSLVVALTFVPMTSSLILKPHHEVSKEDIKKERNIFMIPFDYISLGIKKLTEFYEKILKMAVINRKITVIVTLIFVALTALSIPIVGSEFLPQTDENGVSIDITLPKGSLLPQTEEIVNLALEKIEGHTEITDITYTLGTTGWFGMGSSSTDNASITVKLADKTKRRRSAAQLAHIFADDLKDIPGAEFYCVATASSMGQFTGGSSFQMQVSGNDSQTLERIAKEMRDMAATIPGTRDVETSVEEASPQASIKIDRSKAAAYGISPASVAGIVNTAVTGTVATTYKVGGTEYDIRVMQDRNSLDYITDIQNILIPLPTGSVIPLYEIADISVEDAPVSIQRENQQQVITISGNLDGRTSGQVESDLKAVFKDYRLPMGYTWKLSGETQRMNETFSGLSMALIMSLLLVYMIMAAEFESLVYPFIVMFSIPIALTGGILGLLITGVTLNIVSFLGLIMLAGVVINNAIVLVDYTNLLIRERGMSVQEALLTAGPVRLRPILMTTLTTVLGLVPMWFSNGQGSELMKGLAVTVIFGLTLSTLVTLLLIPVIYIIVYDIRAKFKKGGSGVLSA